MTAAAEAVTLECRRCAGSLLCNGDTHRNTQRPVTRAWCHCGTRMTPITEGPDETRYT